MKKNKYMKYKMIIILCIALLAMLGALTAIINVSNKKSITPITVAPKSSVHTFNDKNGRDVLRLLKPAQDAKIANPLIIIGEVRGNWSFEAQFPVKLYDAQNNLLAEAPAMLKGDWMTTDYVPFTASLMYKKSVTTTGTLVLEKDNPSGLREYADEIRVPVKFDLSLSAVAVGNCRPTGCSGQICADRDMISTCEYRPEYDCYQNAVCAETAGGGCGWVETESLKSCLQTARLINK